MAPKLTRVVLADDHPIWRDGVRTDLGDGFWVVGEAGTRRRRSVEAGRRVVDLISERFE